MSEMYAFSTFSHGLYGTCTGPKCSKDRADPHDMRVRTVLVLTESVASFDLGMLFCDFDVPVNSYGHVETVI